MRTIFINFVKAVVVLLFLTLTTDIYSQNTEIIGKLVTRPEPPSSPYSSGVLLYAVRSGDINYITTIGGHFTGLNYFGTLFELNDSVKANGQITIKKDFEGNDYYEIELVSIEKLASAPGIETIKGMMHSISNPATTYPPLPGVVLGVILTTDSSWIPENVRVLSKNGYWFPPDFPLIIGAYQFNQGDSATITGYSIEHYDIFNKPYYTIEIGNGGGIVSTKNNILYQGVSLYPNPCNSKIQCEASYNKIESIEIFNSNGQLVFCDKEINKSQYEIGDLKDKGVLLVKIVLDNKQVITKKVMSL